MIKRILNKIGISKNYPLVVNGQKFSVPIRKGIGFTHFADSEPWMDEILKKLGQPKSNFLDVGVNIGQTLLKWKALFPDSNYVGFEPNQNCVAYVENLIALNTIKKCELQPYGLATEKTSTKLFLLGTDKGDSSATTIENFREGEKRTAIEIKTIPLKHIKNNVFDLIKIDVEGAELGVLESVFEVNNSALIICEILPVYSKNNTERLGRQKAIESLLVKNEYLIYRIIKDLPVQLHQLSSFDIHGDLAKSDYVFIPKKQEKEIIARFK